jgi:hypothetical protein
VIVCEKNRSRAGKTIVGVPENVPFPWGHITRLKKERSRDKYEHNYKI